MSHQSATRNAANEAGAGNCGVERRVNMALQFRTIDGSNNNLADPSMNQIDTDFARLGPANFSDGVNAMTWGPNPRDISNIVVAQGDTGENGPYLVDGNGIALSGMMYAWGQFIDHDMDLE